MAQGPNDNITFFAKTNFRNQQRRFGIKVDDRRRHMYVIGKTGMGKSVLLTNMAYQDIINGNGVAVIDPHGDLVEDLLNYIPNYRVNDVIYFNPSDINFPIAFNPLESVNPEHRHLIASGLIGVFKKLWADSWGPRLEYLLRNAILALLDYPGSTLLGVTRILVDKDFREKVVAKIQDPVVKMFWTQEYTKYSAQFQVEAISPIQNKVGQFLSNFLIRNIVGQVKSTIDMRKVMDEGKILLLNLSKGRIGEDTSQLLGAMMITKIQLAAMSRVDIPETERRDFYLYVDEFQNFATESFANILSEARKYHLNLIIAHQYVEQLGDEVKAAVFGNVGTLICFRVGSVDAEELVKEFTPRFTEEDLVNLTKFNIYLRLMIDGVASDPFSATTLPPLFSDADKNTGNLEKVIAVSRERYANTREEVEDKIMRWTGMAESMAQDQDKPVMRRYEDDRPKTNNRPTPRGNTYVAPVATPKPVVAEPETVNSRVKKLTNPKNSQRPYETICDNCGATTHISFIPDPTRPIYCKNCMKKSRAAGQNPTRLPVKNPGQGQVVQGLSEAGPVLAEKVISLGEINKQKPVTFRGKGEENAKPAVDETPTSKTVTPGQVIRFD